MHGDDILSHDAAAFFFFPGFFSHTFIRISFSHILQRYLPYLFVVPSSSASSSLFFFSPYIPHLMQLSHSYFITCVLAWMFYTATVYMNSFILNNTGVIACCCGVLASPQINWPVTTYPGVWVFQKTEHHRWLLLSSKTTRLFSFSSHSVEAFWKCKNHITSTHQRECKTQLYELGIGQRESD